MERFCRINDEKLDHDIAELQEYVELLERHLKTVQDPLKFRKMKQLDREARLMIQDLKDRKLLNHED